MSSIIVLVRNVVNIRQHPNADRLLLANTHETGGWQTCIRKMEDGSPEFQEGEKAVYIPADAAIPQEVAERLNVVTYLAKRVDIENVARLVVRKINLRGQPSYGFFIKCPDPTWEVGRDVMSHFGIEKFIPPIKTKCGDSAAECQLFQKYTHIENIQNFPDVFQEGESVFITEKVHGTNCRVGMIEGVEMAGSHEVNRKRPLTEEDLKVNRYWFPLSLPNVKTCLHSLAKDYAQVVLYGEVYGPGIQNLTYGRKAVGFAAFDLLLNGKYYNYDDFLDICEQYDIETVPILERAVFSQDLIKRLSSGKTTMGADHIREGCVIRPIIERSHPAIGRVILKAIGDEYATSKGYEKEDTSDI